MKKTSLLSLLLFCATMSYAQIIFKDDLEQGLLSGWQFSGEGGRLSTQEQQEGKASIELYSGGKVRKQITLMPKKRYRLSAYLRTSSGAEEIQIGIDGLKYNNRSLASALTAWTYKELLFETDENQKMATIELYHPVSIAGNSAWGDLICVELLGNATTETPKTITPPDKRNAVEDMGVKQLSNEQTEWMLDAKIGMFIHWGLYAGPAKGEWYMRNKSVPIDSYRKYAYPESGEEQFLADKFNANEWVELAKEAGMKYMNLTAQHHDGYALFNSSYPNSFTSYQTHNRDFVAEYVQACRIAGLKVGLYKTLINWRYPGYYDVTGENCKKNSWGYTTDPGHKENARQMKEELYCMTKELLSKYGKIDQFFWDGGWLAEQGSDADGAYFWESGKYLDPKNQWPIDTKYTLIDSVSGKPLGLMGMVRELQPDIVVNPRCGWKGDYLCEEGGAKISGPVRTNQIYEKCLSLHFAWGYTPLAEDKNKVVNANRVKRYLTDCLMRNMCLLVNVGPDKHGQITQAEANVLRQVGAWIRSIEEAVYGTRGGPWNPVDEMYGFSYKKNKIYIYLLENYTARTFILPAIEKRNVKSIYLVDSKKKLSYKKLKSTKVEIRQIPEMQKENPIRVIAVELDENIFE